MNDVEVKVWWANPTATILDDGTTYSNHEPQVFTLTSGGEEGKLVIHEDHGVIEFIVADSEKKSRVGLALVVSQMRAYTVTESVPAMV